MCEKDNWKPTQVETNLNQNPMDTWIDRINEINRFLLTTNQIKPDEKFIDLLEERDILKVKVHFEKIRQLK
jgi:hypothetical protein